MSKESVLLSFQQAIKDKESSGGMYDSYNKDSGAGGAYQFMPDTWKYYAHQYGYDDYADTAPQDAPPEVQDGLFMAYASDLYDTFNGDMRYMADAHYAGITAAKAHYEQGQLPEGSEGNYPSQSEYSNSAAESAQAVGEFSSSHLEAGITTNHPENNEITNVTNLKPQSIYGSNVINAWLEKNYGINLVITGAAEGTEYGHQGGDYSHPEGWKIDVAPDGIDEESFIQFCHSNGWTCVRECRNTDRDHYDICFAGIDSRDPIDNPAINNDNWQTGFTGDPLGGLTDVADKMNSSMFTGQQNTPLYDVHEHDYDEKPQLSFWGALATNFMDSVTTTGFADAGQYLWGNLFHSSNHFGRMSQVTQEDVDYVKNALPNDPDAQKFALLNGRDSEEIRWFVNQKLVDNNRRAQVEQWRAGNQSILQKFAVSAAGGIGYMVDPLLFVPYANAFKGLQIASRIGEAIYDVSKVSRIASRAATIGLEGAAGVTVDNYLREKTYGEKPEYGWSAALAFAGGSTLGLLGGLFKHLRSNTFAEDVAIVADRTETAGMASAADLDPRLIRNETIEQARKLHNPEYGKEINSKYYNELEKNGRVVATTYEEARALVSRASGIEIPEGTKAFYVPNEDYAMLITDNLSKGEAVNVLSHEFAVHAGLKRAIGEKAYTKLMDDVDRLSSKDGHVFHEAREKAGSYDPEEIFAYAVENNMLPKGIVSNLKGALNIGLKNNGINAKITAEQVKGLLEQQAIATREATTGIHINPDGSTAFAGIKFSKDNFLNPAIFARFYELEKAVTKNTQKDLPFWMPKVLGQKLEQGVGGLTINSPSNVVRQYANKLFDDARGRGFGVIDGMSAETNRGRLLRKLSEPLLKLYSARQDYCIANKQLGRAGQMAYNKMVIMAYNARKEVGNIANVPSTFPEEVMRGVKHLEEMNKLQIELGMRSARDVGSASDNLIDKDWVPVDFEFRRVVDNDRRIAFMNMFINDNVTGTTAYQSAKDFLAEYYNKFAKRDVIKAKIVRDIEQENKKITEYNDKIPEGSKRKPKELKSTEVSDEQIQAWLDERLPAAMDRILGGETDIISREGMGSIGSLPFLKERIPIDTTGVLVIPKVNKEFSFDNNLRSFDLDSIAEKNNSRLAGECAIKNVFNTQKDLDDFLNRAKTELQKAKDDKHINQSQVDETMRHLKDSINEIRGMRPNMDAMSRWGAALRLLKKLTYAFRGTNMMWAQLGELGGTIAYGGATQLFHAIRPLGKFVEDIKYGKMNAEDMRSTANAMFGEKTASKIFTTSWGDRVTRDALTKGEVVDKALIMANDIAANLGKATSAVNMLPKMTDAMEKGIQECTILDALQWAGGREFSSLRNPFSAAKLKAAHLKEADVNDIKKCLNTYKTESGYGLDVATWQKEKPVEFAKFYNLVQRQVDRAIVNGSKIGNRNILKESHPFVSLMFQFKDYTLRAINAQSMRAMSARDLDDALATSFSIVTNIASYAARGALTYGCLSGLGATKLAEEKWNTTMSPENLIRVAAFRSTLLGSPFSIANDFYESLTGSQTIRTTVNRTSNRPINGVEDLVGNFVSQTPALDTASTPYDIGKYFYEASENKANKRDFKNFLNAFPMSNFIPFAAFISNYVDGSGYPDKRPK